MDEMKDVKELIWTRRNDLKDQESRMNEWMTTVQDVVRMNAGWKCVRLIDNVRYILLI